jgi:hypothetical protein
MAKRKTRRRGSRRERRKKSAEMKKGEEREGRCVYRACFFPTRLILITSSAKATDSVSVCVLPGEVYSKARNGNKQTS